MTTSPAEWERVGRQRAEAIAGRPSEYDAVTIRNLDDLLALVRSAGGPAPQVGPGYWPTFSVGWENAPEAENLEIEVFGDRYEVYRFHDGRTDIGHYERAPGEPIPEAVVSELPRPTAP